MRDHSDQAPTRRVLAVALDAAEWPYVTQLVQAGELPTLARLCASGTTYQLSDDLAHRHGLVFHQFLAGRKASLGVPWESMSFDPRRYSTTQTVAGQPGGVPAFYRRAGVRTIAFDVPWLCPTETPGVIELAAWGADAPMYPRAAAPRGLLREIDSAVGVHPAFENDYDMGWHSKERIDVMVDALATGASRRAQAVRWLTERFPDWELLLVAMSEPHSAGEFLWHGVDPTHPLAAQLDSDHARLALRAVYRSVDTAIGEMIGAVPSDTAVVVFSLYGIRNSPGDVPSVVLLPELLHRLAGHRPMVTASDPRSWRALGCPPVLPDQDEVWASAIERYWLGPKLRDDPRPPLDRLRHIWTKRHSPVARLINRFEPSRLGVLGYPIPGETHVKAAGIRASRGPTLDWQFCVRYRPSWHRMTAFTIPSFSEGMIRVNLVGREAKGIVEPSSYRATLDALERELSRCVNPRTEKPAVAGFTRTRSDNLLDPEGPYADLIVEWEGPTDALEHPDVGMVGPVPFHRIGTHSDTGFAVIHDPSTTHPPPNPPTVGSTLDVPPTILSLLGRTPDADIDGCPLLPVRT